MKLDKITPEQENQMIAFREEWRQVGINCDPVDKEKTKEVISAFYRKIGKEPPIFIFCPSPAFVQFQIAYCKSVLPQIKELFGKELKDSLRSNLRSNLWSNLESNLRSNLGSNLESSLWSNLWSNLRSNLRSNLGSNLWSNLGSNLGSNLWSNLGSNLGFEDGYFWGQQDSFWIAFYMFPEIFLGIKYDSEKSELLKMWSELAKSCNWWHPYENFCFVSDRPESLHFDPMWRLHSEDRP